MGQDCEQARGGSKELFGPDRLIRFNVSASRATYRFFYPRQNRRRVSGVTAGILLERGLNTISIATCRTFMEFGRRKATRAKRVHLIRRSHYWRCSSCGKRAFFLFERFQFFL